jgi:hypothetical protein
VVSSRYVRCENRPPYRLFWANSEKLRSFRIEIDLRSVDTASPTEIMTCLIGRRQPSTFADVASAHSRSECFRRDPKYEPLVYRYICIAKTGYPRCSIMLLNMGKYFQQSPQITTMEKVQRPESQGQTVTSVVLWS